MAKYEGTATFKIIDGMYLTTDADDAMQAEFDMIEMVRESEPDATDIEIEGVKEID